MSSSIWRKSTSVVARLIEQPQNFNFIQVIRLLEMAAARERASDSKLLSHTSKQVTQSLAFFSPPENEAIRITSAPSLSFPESAIVDIKKNKDKNQWAVVAAHMGITGAMGVMPYHYTELLLQRLRLKDDSLKVFLDLFNHRILSLFYRASTKYRPAIEYNRTHCDIHLKPLRNDFDFAIRALCGIASKGLAGRQIVPDEALIYYSGLFNQSQKTESGLAQILNDYFDVPVRIHSFVGNWQELIDDVRTRLGSRDNPKGQNVCLGRNAMLGKRGWFTQGKSRIVVGPLNEKQYDQFAPGTPGLNALSELSLCYLGLEQEFDFVIEVNRADIPERVKLGGKEKAIVGWNSWLSGRPKTQTEKDNIIEINISARH